jgi:hypothetical protein
MDSDFGDSSDSAAPDYDVLSTWKDSTDSGYRTMDSMPSRRKDMDPSYGVYTSNKNPIHIINHGGRFLGCATPTPSLYVRGIEALPRKEQDRNRTLAHADITTRKEKRKSFVRDWSLCIV